MRHLRCFVLAAATAALFTASPAGAHPLNEDRPAAIFTPAKPAWLGEAAAQFAALPVAENPYAGNGNQCLTVGQKVLQIVGSGPCRIQEGWTLFLGYGGGWANVVDPFPQTQAQQCALARAEDRASFIAARLTVDGTATVDLLASRFELCSPQRTVLMPADNILGVPGPQIVTLTAHGWYAAVRQLRPGRHTIVGESTFADGPHFTLPITVIVVPRHAADNPDGHQADR
jgi:hypothetical protein